MSDLPRRELLAAVTGLAMAGSARSDQAAERFVNLAYENPELCMFAEQQTVMSDPAAQYLRVPHVKNSKQGYDELIVPRGAMRIFRMRVDHDEFTKKGASAGRAANGVARSCSRARSTPPSWSCATTTAPRDSTAW